MVVRVQILDFKNAGQNALFDCQLTMYSKGALQHILVCLHAFPLHEQCNFDDN